MKPKKIIVNIKETPRDKAYNLMLKTLIEEEDTRQTDVGFVKDILKFLNKKDYEYAGTMLQDWSNELVSRKRTQKAIRQGEKHQ